MKEQNRTVYIRKEAQITLRELSEKTRLSQSEILAQWLSAVSKVMSEFPNCYRITYASYEDVKSKPKRVMTFLSPILSENLQFEPLNMSQMVDDCLAAQAVRQDIQQKIEKVS